MATLLTNERQEYKAPMITHKFPAFIHKYSQNWPVSLSILLSLILIAMILVNIFRNIYFFLPSQDKLIAQQLLTNKVEQIIPEHKNISQWHLFGISLKSDVAVTHLSLKLTGILFNMPGKQAAAIIDTPDGKEKVYYKGDDLPGGAKIYSIGDHGVIILYLGRLESLPLRATIDNNATDNNATNTEQNTPVDNTANNGPIENNPNLNGIPENYLNLLKRFRNLGQ